MPEYLVRVQKTITYGGEFLVKSKKKLTEDEAMNAALALANEEDVEPEDGWEEEDTEYEAQEIVDGEDDLKEE